LRKEKPYFKVLLVFTLLVGFSTMGVAPQSSGPQHELQAIPRGLSDVSSQSFSSRHSLNDECLSSHSKLSSPSTFPLPASATPLIWNQTYGDTGTDRGDAIVECSSGGFAIAGYSYGGASQDDFLLVRTDADGNHLWNQTYDTGGGDWAYGLAECDDGGFAIAGSTDSGPGSSNVWLVRTDASGNPLWNYTYGASNDDGCYSLIQCASGGFALVGTTNSYGVGPNSVWMVRVTSNGQHLWNQSYGDASNWYSGYDVVECANNDFAINGLTDLNGGDMILMRIDAGGTQLWNQCYGGALGEWGRSLVECTGGGFALTGFTESYGAGNEDLWIVRTAADGSLIWNQTYGYAGQDIGRSIVECSGGGFAAAGFGGDGWLVRTDANGNHLWNQSYGGSGTEEGRAVIKCSDGGFAVAGRTTSYGAGGYDLWLVRIHRLGWQETPTDYELELGTNLRYDLNATSSVGINSWWLNTTLFDIDPAGVITNQVQLMVKDYGVAVGVNDQNGDFRVVVFTVQVQDTAAPNWITAPVNQVLEYGTALNYQIPVMDLSGVDHWTLNDTSNFSLSTTYYQGWGSTAQITSTGTLSLGNYGLNVTVYDNYDNGRFAAFTIIVQDTTPPTWITAPTDQVIELGTAFSYDLDATDALGLQQWSINDTTHFTIDAAGVITSLDALPVATYGLRVQITDTSNNPLIGIFSVKVQDTTPPAWVILPSDQSIPFGQALAYQVEANDLSGIAQWTISDTAHFFIDATGLITSVGTLEVGSYDLNVTAIDPYGNAISRLFTVTVESLPPVNPVIVLLGLVIAVILVVAVIVVIRRRMK
jgi:hypothetical protein